MISNIRWVVVDESVYFDARDVQLALCKAEKETKHLTVTCCMRAVVAGLDQLERKIREEEID